MDAQAYEIARVTETAGNVRNHTGRDTGDLDASRGVVLGLTLSLAAWALLIVLLVKGIF